MNIITARKTHGYRVITDPSGKVISESDSHMCPHCGLHFEIVPGSGIRRMWCGKCNAVCCGSEACAECVPWEQKMCEIEADATKHLRGY